MENNQVFSKKFLNIFPIISALMVVGIHSYNASAVTSLNITNMVEGVFSHGLFCAAVPTFFIVSGYLFFRNITSLEDVFGKQRKRIHTLVIPFLAWSAFYYVFYTIAYYLVGIDMVHAPSKDVWSVIKGILLYEYCFPLWYLFQLILYTAITPVVYLGMRKMKAVLWFVVIVCWLASVLGFNTVGNMGGTLERAVFHVNFFGYWLTGCILSQSKINIIDLLRKVPLYILIVVLGGGSIISALLFDDVIKFGYDRQLVPFITFLYILILISISDNIHEENILAKNEIPTIIIYGIHPFVGQVGGVVFKKLSGIPMLAQYFMSFFFVSVLSILVAMIMKRYLKPLYKIFGGGR